MSKLLKRYYPLFLLPTLIAFFIAFFIPLIMGIYLSFTEFTTVTDAEFIGFQNYILAFENQDFLNALWFTLRFTAVSVISVNLIAFFLALALTKKLPGTNIFRTIFFMPNLIGGIVLGYIGLLIINGILLRFGVTLTYSPAYGFWGLIFLMNWQMIGYMMVIYIAGIQNIPPELIEAAHIDGANNLRILRHITIPLVMPSVTICLFLTLTNSFKLFDQNLALTAGEPRHTTEMLALNIYNTFYARAGAQWKGMGQAKAVIFCILVIVISLIQFKATHSKEVQQ